MPGVRPRAPVPAAALVAVTGASGAGKSTVGRLLLEQLGFRVVVLDQDLLWSDAFRDGPPGRFRAVWLRMVAALHQNGRRVVLCGTTVPGQFEGCAERSLVGRIHYVALACDDEVLRARLRARPGWRRYARGQIEEAVAFNRWVRTNAATTTPTTTLLDTTGVPADVTAAQVRAAVADVQQRCAAH